MEILFFAIIVALLGYIVWKDRQISKERREMINAILSKNAIEFATANEITEDKKEAEEQAPPEFVPQDSLTDDEFTELIRKNNESIN